MTVLYAMSVCLMDAVSIPPPPPRTDSLGVKGFDIERNAKQTVRKVPNVISTNLINANEDVYFEEELALAA